MAKQVNNFITFCCLFIFVPVFLVIYWCFSLVSVAYCKVPFRKFTSLQTWSPDGIGISTTAKQQVNKWNNKKSVRNCRPNKRHSPEQLVCLFPASSFTQNQLRNFICFVPYKFCTCLKASIWFVCPLSQNSIYLLCSDMCEQRLRARISKHWQKKSVPIYMQVNQRRVTVLIHL